MFCWMIEWTDGTTEGTDTTFTCQRWKAYSCIGHVQDMTELAEMIDTNVLAD